MPKPTAESMLPDAAVESTGAMGGKYEILGSVYKVHKDKEYEPKPGAPVPVTPRVIVPVCALVFKVTPISDDGDRLEDADTRDIILKMGSKSLATFHPGKGSDPSDMDPDDLGDELNTEGNTLYISGGSVEMNAKSGYTVFMKSLQHRGFPKEKIAECWAPHFTGLKFELATVTPDKLEGYGQKKGDANKDGENITYKVVQSIIAQPDDKKGSKKEKKAAPAATTTAVAVKEDVPATTSASVPASSGDADYEAKRVLGAVAVKLGGKTKKLDQARTFYVTLYSDNKVKGDEKLKEAARKLVNDDSWLVEALDDLGCTVDMDDKTVTFPELKKVTE
jgi:hypothetical protein